jgi:hypothetical protein
MPGEHGILEPYVFHMAGPQQDKAMLANWTQLWCLDKKEVKCVALGREFFRSWNPSNPLVPHPIPFPRQ